MIISNINKYENKCNLKDKVEQEKIVSNTDYISWLNEFTEMYSSFSTDDWLYDNTKLTKEDINNVSNMRLFYKAIEEYAINNYINPMQTKYGMLYSVKYNDIGHIIGTDFSRYVVYCYRVKPDEVSIEFEDIINKKEQEKTKAYNVKLLNLERHLLALSDSGIPVDFIENRVSKVLKKIKEK